jgi:hypothetical protein
MLTLLFSSLQSSLNTFFSKPFLYASMLPLVLFLSACAGLAARVGGRPAAIVNQFNPAVAAAGANPWYVMAFVFGVIGGAVILAGLNGVLMQVLEGKHIGPFRYLLLAAEISRFLQINSAYRSCEDEYLRIADRAADWAARLRKPRIPCPANPGALRLWLALIRVHARRRCGARIPAEYLEYAVNLLSNALAGGRTPRLERMHVTLLSDIDCAQENLILERQRLNLLRQFEFPYSVNATPGQNSVTVTAPTRFGNITRTIRTYALDRYGLDLNIFWTRLQTVLINKQKDTFSALQDAKNQVDFLVAAFWLTVLFTGGWSALLIWTAPRPAEFLILAVAGPLLARALYNALCQNYIVFADLMRSAVDLHRSDLLDMLRLDKPPGNAEEKELWQRLGEWVGYGAATDITYKP